MPNARKLPSGNYRARIYIGTENGKKIYKSFTNADKHVAENMATEYLTHHKFEEKSGMTLKQAMEKYNEVKINVLSPSSIKGYESYRKNNYKLIENYPLEALNNKLCAEWIADISQTLSPKSIKCRVGYLQSVLAMYAPEKRLKFVTPKKKRVSYHIVTDEEIKALLATTKGTKIGLAIRLAVFIPARRSEICALTYEDIINNSIVINKAIVQDSTKAWVTKQPKTESSYRSVVMPDEIIKEIGTGKGNVFDGWTPTTIYEKFKWQLHLLGFDFRFHDLRHYGATYLHAQGVPDKYIMQRGGWASLQTLQEIYTHCLPDKTTEVDKIVEKKLLSLGG